MGKKFEVWLDSGANSHSCYEQVVSLDDLGCTDAEWDAMTDGQKEELMKEVAWDRMVWGFRELGG